MRQAVRQTLTDRIVNYFSPLRGAQRMRARMTTSLAMGTFGGFKGAGWGRSMREWFTPNTTADDALLGDLDTLRARSRDMVRNTPLASGAIQTVCQNVVGTGLQLQSRPDAARLGLTDEAATAFKAQVESEFRLWCESTECDITRTQNFYGLQDLTFRSALESGDCFVLTPMLKDRRGPYQTCLQVVEADRVCNPVGKIDTETLRAGIEFDQYGAPLRYHVRRRHPASSTGITDTTEELLDAFGLKTGRRNVLHLYDRKRPGQSRGYPYLAPVIEPLKQLDRYSEAEVMAAVISAMFTVFITTPTGEGFAIEREPAVGGGGSSGLPTSNVKLGQGAIIDLMPGEKPEFANPTRPNAGFDPFVQAVLRQIGVALSIPFEVLIKHFTASYSAARAAIIEAWVFFRNRRAFLVDYFCQPVFETWMEEAVYTGRVAAPGFFADAATRRAYCQTEWIGSAPVQIDPEKEVNASEKMVNLGVSTLADECLRLTGKVWDDQHKQAVKEREARVRDGLISPIPPMPPGLQAPSGANTGSSGTNQPDGGGSDLQQADNAPPPPKGGN